MTGKILIVDDDVTFSGMLARQVQDLGHSVAIAGTIAEGLTKVKSIAFDVVFLDVNLPDGSGLDALGQFQAGKQAPEVIIVTGFGDPDGAELAIRSGAWDYLSKGASICSAQFSLTRALRYRNDRATSPPPPQRPGIIGSCESFKTCLHAVHGAANSAANVLLVGETGTGKELLAQAIHQGGNRSEQSFVVVDCAALPETLVESVLFGHVKGAFTGADADRDGLVAQANGGTLFLDEVAELPLNLQKTFLRVLQEHRYRRVGGSTEIPSEFRLIAATNRDLDEMAAAGTFRKDLLFRLRSLSIHVPPLRERLPDIAPLALHYVGKACEALGLPGKGISPDFLEVMLTYSWPGNVRELVNTIEGVVALASDDPILYGMHLPAPMRAAVMRTAFQKAKESEPETSTPQGAGFPHPLPPLKNVRELVEQSYLTELMPVTNWDVDKAARVAGLSRARIYSLLKKYRVTRTTE